jgi:hypothetical protein
MGQTRESRGNRKEEAQDKAAAAKRVVTSKVRTVEDLETLEQALEDKIQRMEEDYERRISANDDRREPERRRDVDDVSLSRVTFAQCRLTFDRRDHRNHSSPDTWNKRGENIWVFDEGKTECDPRHFNTSESGLSLLPKTSRLDE